tara:strand:+ start:69 stop:785 length:717 start_codon:yes stop_codon:yes gene_type:complete
MKTVYYILIIVLFVYIINRYIEIEDYFEFKRSHPRSFPLVSIEDNFLSPNECKDIKDYILKHELLNNNWGKNDFVIRFNTSEYSKKMFLEKKLEKIYKIFERIKQPGTNAYIVNTAILSNSHNSEEYNDIEFHYDDTIELKDFMGRNILPVCTTILYINIPENYTGGNLILEPFANKNKEKVYYKPKQGRRLTFRGDMHHSVEPFFCDYTTKRISLVFEQYKIPDKYIHETEFNIDER